MDVEGEGDFETTLKGVVGSGKVRMKTNHYSSAFPLNVGKVVLRMHGKKFEFKQFLFFFSPYCIRRLTLSPRARAETRFEFDTCKNMTFKNKTSFCPIICIQGPGGPQPRPGLPHRRRWRQDEQPLQRGVPSRGGEGQPGIILRTIAFPFLELATIEYLKFAPHTCIPRQILNHLT